MQGLVVQHARPALAVRPASGRRRARPLSVSSDCGGPRSSEPWEQPQVVEHTQRLLESFRRKIGRDLHPGLADARDVARFVYDGPFCVLSHDTDMQYNYANRAAQQLWGYSWKEYMGMDSWRSTPASEAEAMEGRRKLWAHMDVHGKMLGFEGLRVAKDGSLFTIKDVTVWTVDLPDGTFLGHAVIFDHWETSEGEVVYAR